MTTSDTLRREIRQIINLLRLYGREQQYQHRLASAWAAYRKWKQ